MSYFEAKAAEYVRDDKEKVFNKYADLTRFKEASDKYEAIMNAIKKKMEAVRFEYGNNT